MIIDLTQPIYDGMPVYPGDQETALVQTKHYHQDHYANHLLTVNMHAGTHLDGPMHLVDRTVYMDDLPIDTFIGEGCLIDVEGQAIVDYKPEYEQLIHEGQIVIIHTGYSRYYGKSEYYSTHPVLTLEFAELLVRKQVKMIGLDTPSPDYEPFAVHKCLLQQGILIIENLNRVEQLLDAEAFDIVALPLRIHADSSPARVIAKVYK